MILISVVIGLIIGAVDTGGFYYTARTYLGKAAPHGRRTAGILETVRIAVLILIMLYLGFKTPLNFWWLIVPALFVSLAGKIVVTFKKLTA